MGKPKLPFHYKPPFEVVPSGEQENRFYIADQNGVVPTGFQACLKPMAEIYAYALNLAYPVRPIKRRRKDK